MNQQKQELFERLKSLSFKRGKFTLASGQTSDFYMDCRLTTLDARGSYLIGHLLYEEIARMNIDAVGGMSLGADPIVSSILYRAAETGHDLKGVLIRKQAKGHGTGRRVEGPIQPWMRVVMVEDVVTTGGSTLQAIEAIRQEWPQVEIVKVLAIVDRNGGGREAFSRLRVPFQALYNVQEFLQG